jgi:hypothetical protein
VTGALSSTTGANFATSSGNVGIGTASPGVSLQVNGIIRAATAADAGVLSLGESTGGTAVNVGLWRGLSNSLSGGNVLNLGGYSGIQFSTGAAVIGSQTSRMFLSDTGVAVAGEVAPATLRFNRSGGAAWDSNGIRFQIDGTTYGKIGMNDSSNLRMSSGLVVDGALAIGNTVATAVAVASTHKVTIVIGGVTYYLLATNV